MKKRNFEVYPFEIQLFSEGAESGDSVSAAAGQAFSGECDTDTDNEFQALIKGKYKDAFGRKTRSIINRRFKETKALEEYKEKAETVFSYLAEKYGDFEGDPEKLLSRMKEEGEASASGPEKAYAVKSNDESIEVAENAVAENAVAENPEAENAAVANAEPETEPERANRREMAAFRYAKWQREAEALKALYPDFDLVAECKSGEFLALLSGGASLKGAYHAVHHDSIMKSAMEYTAKIVSEAISRNMAKAGSRPFENGLSPRSGINPVRDVNSLTDRDIADILKEVAKGKIIRF